MATDLGRVTRPDRTGWTAPWLDWLDAALHREILRLRARYELTSDELRGLYVSDEQVDRLVRHSVPGPDEAIEIAAVDDRRAALLATAHSLDGPLALLARRFDLDEPGLLAVVATLAPEVELGYQSIYAYLNDDVTRRLPSVDLCARLGRGRLGSGRAIEPDDDVVAGGLLLPVRVEGAPLWRSAGLVLAEPVRRFLLASRAGVPRPRSGDAGTAHHGRLVLIESRSEPDGLLAAEQLAQAEGVGVVRPEPLGDPSGGSGDPGVAAALLRARLAADLLVVTVDELGPLELDGLAQAPVRVALVVHPERRGAFALAGVEVQRVVVQPPDAAERTRCWSAELARHGLVADPGDVEHVAGVFRLDRTRIAAAARIAASGAVASEGDRSPSGGDLTAAARESSARELDGIATEVTTGYGWDELVLPASTRRRVEEFAEAVRHRHVVFEDWGLGRLVGGHASVRALFSGASGTGKTMAAAVVAGDLGLPLYRVDLSSVVSKYIGETEKNIERILVAAESGNAMLLFDEADALFGKRTEVKDAHDRYANIETAYLLQRLETFDGVVVLATNLAGNLDEAFGRRIQFQIDFPVPDEALRERLWRRALPSTAPMADDVDPAFLAGMFALTGGDIRSAALMAAFLAAREGESIAMTHLVRALARQRRLQGKVPSVSEFGDYLRLVREEDT